MSRCARHGRHNTPGLDRGREILRGTMAMLLGARSSLYKAVCQVAAPTVSRPRSRGLWARRYTSHVEKHEIRPAIEALPNVLAPALLMRCRRSRQSEKLVAVRVIIVANVVDKDLIGGALPCRIVHHDSDLSRAVPSYRGSIGRARDVLGIE